jgi:GntR family transcriptional regulator
MINLIVDKNCSIPIYYQIREAIRSAIMNGQLKKGDLLPSYSELSSTLGVSKMTIRQALDGLVQEGLLSRYRGKGVFVMFPKLQHSLQSLTSFTEDMILRGLKPGSRILFFGKVIPNQTLVQNLDVPQGSLVLRIHRVRFANDNPVGIHDSYLAPGISFSQEELEKEESLYSLLEKKGIILLESEEYLEAIGAIKEESELLGVPLKYPLLLVSRIVFGLDKKPIEYVRAIYHSDFYRYSIRLRRLNVLYKEMMQMEEGKVLEKGDDAL